MNKKFKGQLVCQHLEKISRRLIEDYPEVIREFVRGRHGIYALYRKNHLYYVGLASNLPFRLKHHLRDRHGHTWDRFSIYLTISDAHLKELESLVLRISSPKGNVQAGKFICSQDLRRTVYARIRDIQKKERMDLFGEDILGPEIRKPKLIDKEQGILAQYTSKRFHIRFRYKSKLYIAHVRRDGWISFDVRSAEYKRFKGKKFRSPSGAGQAVTKRTTDGWRCWKYERSPGEWVLLDELRKK
jgi:hypothetical protein